METMLTKRQYLKDIQCVFEWSKTKQGCNLTAIHRQARFPVMYSGLPVEWNPLCLVLTLTQLHRKFHHVDIELWSSSQSPSIQQQCKTPQAERVWVTESPSKYSTVTVSMTKSLPERYQQWVPSARLHRNDSPKPRTPRRGPQTCVIRYKIQLCRGWGGTLHCNTEGSWGSGP